MALTLSTRRRVAKTDLERARPRLRRAHLGELYGKVDEADSRATLEAAWDAGVRYYDTAPWYGRGLSEHRLGGFLRTKPRDEFQITTKVGRYLAPPEGSQDLRPRALGGRAEVRGQLRLLLRRHHALLCQLLQRLGLDTVDALIIHDLDAAYHTPEDFSRAQEGPPGVGHQGARGAEEGRRHQGHRHGHQHRPRRSRPSPSSSISTSASSPCPTRCSTSRASTPAWRPASSAASR